MFLGACDTLAGSVAPADAEQSACLRNWNILARYPHDVNSFTQGLVKFNGRLFESIGGYGSSAVLEIDQKSGKPLQRRPLDSGLFGEGLTQHHGKLIQLTWHAGLALTYNLQLQPLLTHRYPGQGWGLTSLQQGDSEYLIMSNGSSTLRWLDPESFEEVRSLPVTDNGRPVTLLNELETRGDKILANVWRADRIAEIDPLSGRLSAWIDLSPLRDRLEWPLGEPRETDLNGIALEPGGSLLVTGKRWPLMFEIELGDCR